MQADVMLQLKYAKRNSTSSRASCRRCSAPTRPPGPVLPRGKYGADRWDRAQVALHDLLYVTSNATTPRRPAWASRCDVPREQDFAGTPVQPLFGYVEGHAEQMLLPRLDLLLALPDADLDGRALLRRHLAGAAGHALPDHRAMLFAVPMGVIAAIYLVEYAAEGRLVSLLRSLHQHAGGRAEHRLRPLRAGLLHQHACTSRTARACWPAR